jgi:glycosyltransferase involved in cell wall biosynthesis
MSFAEQYIRKHCIFPRQILPDPHAGLNIAVVIPCYNEPSLINTLEALWNCERPCCAVEVIIVINSGENSPQSAVQNNIRTEEQAITWISNHFAVNFKFHIIVKAGLPRKHAGVGLARKTGMDEAVIRFNYLNNPGGIIISFDADSVCERNFLTEIENHFISFPRTNGCSVYFEHPLEGTEFPPDIYEAITWYELYLRYYQSALKYTGYPYAFYTIGSCFAVRASVYAKQGGMNRRQAGEDFYFLQKIIPLGNFYEINTTRVIPSPRPSKRVPFGTGATVHKYIGHGTNEPYIYNFQAFNDLKKFFESVPELFRKPENDILQVMSKQSKILAEFLEIYNISAKLKEIDGNSSDKTHFTKRFFLYFNAFRILKYLNYAHENGYKRISLGYAAAQLLDAVGIISKTDNARELLEIFRKEKINSRTCIIQNYKL